MSPGSSPGRSWPKNNNTCKVPWVLHPYQVSSKSLKRFSRRNRKCESLRTPDDDGRRTTTTTDGRTDDGRCAMTIAHLSLWLRWAKTYLCTSDKADFLQQEIRLVYMLNLHWVMLSFYFPHGKYILWAIWWHGIQTNSWDSYGHLLWSTYSRLISILLLQQFKRLEPMDKFKDTCRYRDCILTIDKPEFA